MKEKITQYKKSLLGSLKLSEPLQDLQEFKKEKEAKKMSGQEENKLEVTYIYNEFQIHFLFLRLTNDSNLKIPLFQKKEEGKEDEGRISEKEKELLYKSRERVQITLKVRLVFWDNIFTQGNLL